ncbi:MAG: DinB family protein [Acidobacteriota bacterium]|nr:DinB family protein [Acidobacteriota bacterium]
MPLANALVAELEQEGKSTLRMLERVPADQLDWTPHAKSMTLGRLAWHVVSIPSIATRLLRAGTFDVANAGPPPMPENPDFVTAFRRNLDEARATIAAMDDDALRAPFVLSRNGEVLNETRKIVMIRSIMMNHSYHHRGQLSVYLRMLDVPLPAIYGTSADEKM